MEEEAVFLQRKTSVTEPNPIIGANEVLPRPEKDLMNLGDDHDNELHTRAIGEYPVHPRRVFDEDLLHPRRTLGGLHLQDPDRLRPDPLHPPHNRSPVQVRFNNYLCYY